MKMEDKARDERPELPEGWSWIEDLQEGLGLGVLGKELEGKAEYGGVVLDGIWEIADGAVDIWNDDLIKWAGEGDNARWYKEAQSEGLLEGVDDLYRAIGIAQHECYERTLYEHLDDVLEYAAYDHVKKAYGAAAISDDLAERIAALADGCAPACFEEFYDLTDEAVSELAEKGGQGFMTKDEAGRAAEILASETEERSPGPGLDAEARDAREASAELGSERGQEGRAQKER